ALFLFADTQQQNVRLATRAVRRAIDRELVGRHQRQTAPGEKRRAEQGYGGRRHAAARALPAERGDGARMGQEERGLLPDARDQLVEVVRRGWPLARRDAHARVDVVEQTVVFVVDQLVFLPLLDRLDGEAQLLAHLVVRAAEQIGDTRVHL